MADKPSDTSKQIKKTLDKAKGNIQQSKDEALVRQVMSSVNFGDFTYNPTAEGLGVMSLQEVESKSMQQGNSVGCIKAGRRNDLYGFYSRLLGESGLLRRIQSFCRSTFYTEIGFTINGEDLSIKGKRNDSDSKEIYLNPLHQEIKEDLFNIGIDDHFKKSFANDLFLNGGSTIQITYENTSSYQGPAMSMATKSRKVRFAKAREIQGGAEFPQEVYVSNNEWKSNRNTKVYPIIGSNRRGFGQYWYKFNPTTRRYEFSIDSYIEAKKRINSTENGINRRLWMSAEDVNAVNNENGEKGLTGYYVAALSDPVTDFLYLPYWHSVSAINTIWSYAQMSSIKAGYMKRSLFKAYIIIINRAPMPDDDDEEAQKDLERSTIQNEQGSGKAGGQIILWEYTKSEKSTPYIRIVEIPQINNEKFLKFLDDGYEKKGCFELGVDSEILSLEQKSGGFSNKAATLLFKFLVMNGDVGEELRKPYLDFINFLLGQMGEKYKGVKAYFQEPTLLTYLKEQVKAQSGKKAVEEIELRAQNQAAKNQQ